MANSIPEGANSLPTPILEQLRSETDSLLIDGKREDTLDPNKYSFGFDDKKSKQERNRESAKKCRLRKKEYVAKLEMELKLTKDELTACKRELEVLKGEMSCKIENEYINLKRDILLEAESIIANGVPTYALAEILGRLRVL